MEPMEQMEPMDPKDLLDLKDLREKLDLRVLLENLVILVLRDLKDKLDPTELKVNRYSSYALSPHIVCFVVLNLILSSRSKSYTDTFENESTKKLNPTM